MAVIGESELLCKVKNKESNIVFKVVQERVTPILGLDTCTKLKLIARVKTLKEIQCKDIFEYSGHESEDASDSESLESSPDKFATKKISDFEHLKQKTVKEDLASQEENEDDEKAKKPNI